MEPKEVAIDLIKYYVLRGDSLESLRHSYLGTYNSDYDAAIGGNVWNEKEELIHKGTCDEIVVSEIKGKKCCYVYKLERIFNEIKSGQMKFLI